MSIAIVAQLTSNDPSANAALGKLVWHGYERLDRPETRSMGDTFEAGILPGAREDEGGGTAGIAMR